MSQTSTNSDALSKKIFNQFQTLYPGFCFFITDDEYSFLSNLCIECVKDKELLSNIKFCNDIFKIPPVKTFLVYNEEKIINHFGTKSSSKIQFTDKQKRGIGAFWGTIFKGILNYSESKNVTVSLAKYNVSTASYFIE